MLHVSKDTEAIGQRIVSLHNELHDLWPELIRIAIAIYDPEHDELNTFINSDHGASKLDAYSAKLTDVPSLKNLVDNKQHRVVNDISEFSGSSSAHSKWLIQTGFKSSYTVPLFGHDRFLGFLFFDSDRSNYFNNKKLISLNVYSRLLEAILQNELMAISTLRGAINTTRYLTH